MSSFTNMSLDDIIQKNKSNIRTRSFKPKINSQKSFMSKNGKFDARSKIISKKREQIKDAREKLSQIAKQKDARLRLTQLRKTKQKHFQLEGNIFTHTRNKDKLFTQKFSRDRVFNDLSRQVKSQPLLRVPRKQMAPTLKTHDFRFKPTKITRTIENDIQVIDDPMDSFNLKITTVNDLQNALKKNESRELAMDKEKLRIPHSILKKRPLALQKNNTKEEKGDNSTCEYRIIVSNLRNTVTGGDIQELFGDLGGMLESRLVRPGTAEVIYKTLEDAQKAVDLYHNRQLDGQPMNCLLVAPRTNLPSFRNSSNLGVYSSSSNVKPDISTFHKVLFSHF